jgi:hypothetical protein
LNAVERSGGVKRERETEKLEEQSEAYTSTPLEQPADAQRGKKCPDENDNCDGSLL